MLSLVNLFINYSYDSTNNKAAKALASEALPERKEDIFANVTRKFSILTLYQNQSRQTASK